MTGPHPWDHHAEGNDFLQAGSLYRLMQEDAKARLVASIAGGLAQVSKEEIVERSVGHFRNADPEYGDRVARAVRELRR
jgi:catalase